MDVRYDHMFDHMHDVGTRASALATLSMILSANVPRSLLDVGCGRGAWLRAAIDLGVGDIAGIDGADVPQEILRVDKANIKFCDLSKPFDLGRRFDVALCLEVAEHLPEESSQSLVSSIVAHSDTILFSAACPGQAGQHHINCQWPTYWQSLFNEQGYVCDDTLRWRIWDDVRINPWYRQNIFQAHRDLKNAGRETRLKSVIHPDLHRAATQAYSQHHLDIYEGRMPAAWYMSISLKAITTKAHAHFNNRFARSQNTNV
jgi:Methyltransferase domain